MKLDLRRRIFELSVTLEEPRRASTSLVTLVSCICGCVPNFLNNFILLVLISLPALSEIQIRFSTFSSDVPKNFILVKKQACKFCVFYSRIAFLFSMEYLHYKFVMKEFYCVKFNLSEIMLQKGRSVLNLLVNRFINWYSLFFIVSELNSYLIIRRFNIFVIF